MASLHLVQGPAGGGKSAVVRDMLEAGEVQVAADVTALWVALSGVERDPETGRYPVRLDDPALHSARVAQTAVASFALREGYDVAVTTSRPNQVERWETLVRERDGARFAVRTVDPGMDEVISRLAVEGEPGVDDFEVEITRRGIRPVRGHLSDECRKAIARWYGRQTVNRVLGPRGGRGGRGGGRRR